jgi:heme A synthase
MKLHKSQNLKPVLVLPCCAWQFQAEIAGRIPACVTKKCQREWTSKGCVNVVCGELLGTFCVTKSGDFAIKVEPRQEVVSPSKFEELAGKKTARNWQQSIRLAGEVEHSGLEM